MQRRVMLRGMAERHEPPPAVATPRERVFTWPLVLFLAAVLLIDVGALWRRSRLPAPADAIGLLGDGDLDGDERRPVLGVLRDAATTSPVLAEQWAGLLAAIVLEDRAVPILSHRSARIAQPPESPPPPQDA